MKPKQARHNTQHDPRITDLQGRMVIVEGLIEREQALRMYAIIFFLVILAILFFVSA